MELDLKWMLNQPQMTESEKEETFFRLQHLGDFLPPILLTKEGRCLSVDERQILVDFGLRLAGNLIDLSRLRAAVFYMAYIVALNERAHLIAEFYPEIVDAVTGHNPQFAKALKDIIASVPDHISSQA